MWYEILKFEIKYRTKRPDTYIYFAIVFLFSIVAADVLMDRNSGALGTNSPQDIARIMAIVSAFFTMITSMIMGVAALRDFDHNMESLMFINPIKKRDYLIGRFIGSFIILLFIFCGLLFGLMLGEFMPWRDADVMLPFNFWHYLQPFLYLVIPNIFFCGAVFYVGGALSRKLMFVYIQGVFLLMAYIVTLTLLKNPDNRFFAALLDPFSFQTISVLTQFWTKAERGILMLPIEGVLLYNRLLWIGVGIITLIIGYYKFNFNLVRGKASKKKLIAISEEENKSTVHHLDSQVPKANLYFDIKATIFQFWKHVLFNFKSILKETSFWAIVLCGMSIIFINSISLDTSYGVNSYPATYIIVEELQEMSIYFFLMILLFYSGELVWKERDTKLNGIYDAIPISDFINLAGKFVGLILIYIVLMSALILAGVIFQTLSGYYHYELDVYFYGFFIEIFPFLILLTFISFFFQVLTNHKFLGHIMVVIFFFVTFILLEVLELDHGLYTFGGGDLGTYSDMNGYGHFLWPYMSFKIYWILFSIILFIITTIFSVRGTETHIKKRWKLSKQRLTKPLIKLGTVTILIFISLGSYIFYNTNILNEYSFPKEESTYRANYEKKLKHFEYLPQPKIVDVNLKVDLFPYDRDYSVEGYYMLTNTHNIAINEVHIQKLPNYQVAIEYIKFENGATVNNDNEEYSYYVYRLNTALKPGDSVKMEFKQTFTTNGFVEKSNTKIVYNGTFFDNFHFPTLGYNRNLELHDDNEREEYDLKPRSRRAKINDPQAIKQGRSKGDGEEINFEMIIGTDSSQIAIAPGYLQKKWKEGNRNYYHYKMDKPMSNFYSIVSAKYEVLKDKWVPIHDSLGSSVDLEIYYHKGHEYNLDRMMKGMKTSFDYFSTHFGPYQYKQMRILEFPRYQTFAQSFPNTVPFSEGIGFLMDIDDEHDVDMAFYITAHELAHQWWGHQVNPASVQGRGMISEALAQYSAIMVLKEAYPEEKVRQFIKTQMNRYLTGRAGEQIGEMPLSLVESGQKYIHYGKGLVNLYALQDYIGEKMVNLALKRFIRDWNSYDGLLKTKTERYPTTIDLLGYFREVTPDNLQYIITDLFETVTLYENKATKGVYEELSKNTFKVNLALDVTKYRIDSTGVEKSIPVQDWIDIGVYGEGPDGGEELIYLEKHKIIDQIMQLEILVDQKPIKAGIDPLNKLIDRKTEDNLQTLINSK
ncbi:ABC transporter permease/M1 family aminopeptidase [Aquimarina macrocephali]|uniref:ABC transporter permease/M1 family aminopeptidase n=1 Tax=Aquimarina macrocephali TaxID=666563 RepID=UPI003F668D54